MKVGREAMLCLGTRIKNARKQKGLTQEQLAELARTLDVSSDHLLGLDENAANRSVRDRLSPTAEKALDLLIREIANAVKSESKY